MFGTSCTAKDKYCRLVDSVIVWFPTEVIKTCDVEYLTQGGFVLTDGWLESSELKLAFEMLSDELHCDFKLVSTSEGLYLTDRYLRKPNQKYIFSLPIKRGLSKSNIKI